ncbi:MAG: sigma-54-dependent Fis family transcriptional regulator [Deltaproteobacteria bacterium]|nr:sigma-54-dependent Fis family transcriptional regulator [Deltaproteobacteria bacterium]
MKKKLLIIDDEKENLNSLKRILQLEDYECLTALNAHTALNILKSTWIHLTFLDIRMPEVDGMTLLQTIKKQFPEVEVIMMTAYGDIETAVQAMKIGAFDFITKPLNRALLLKSALNAFQKQDLLLENKILKSKLNSLESTQKWIGISPSMRELTRLAIQVAGAEAPLLIEGESGVGKEVLANFIYTQGNRSKKPFIKVNCATLSENLLESGIFKETHGGTLFLDEISELSSTLQAKLLRLTQSGEFAKPGSIKTLYSDVRIISATNQNLNTKVKEKKFREDLYYRLNVIKFVIPPLRERKEDIPPLVEHFIHLCNHKLNKKISGITQEALQKLLDYNWPGNIRELQNIIERTILLAPLDIIEKENIKIHVDVSPLATIEEMKDKMIERALKLSDGDKKRAADILGVHPRTIYRKLEKEN